MRFSLVGLLLCSLLIRCGPQERSIEEVSIVQEVELLQYYFEGAPFSGLVIAQQTKPTIKIIYTVKEDLLNDTTKHFNQVNELILDQNYASGKLNGLVRSFSPMGQSIILINISMERKVVPKSCTILLEKLRVFFFIKRDR